MPISFYVSSITFSSGDEIEFGPGSTTVLVGPNNSGKTSTLRELKSAIKHKAVGPVLCRLRLQKEGGVRDMQTWLDENVARTESSTLGSSTEAYAWMGSECAVEGYGAFDSLWSENAFGRLADLLCSLLTLEERLAHLALVEQYGTVRSFDILMDAPLNPIHVLLKNEDMERRVSRHFRKAFSVDLIVNRGAGTNFPMHCGEPPPLDPGEDRVSRNYVERLHRLPMLVDQGHGMRSFAGCLMATFASPSLLQFIDEPEAFLHPPQARLIGNILAREKPEFRQLFITTHSGDFLRGVLDSGIHNLNVVRLSREDDKNQARQLDVDRIKQLWSDPILRFSNALDGLFHESVVVCESDADCRFYSAVLQAIAEPDDALPDVFFTSTGGKDRLHVVTSALVGLGVPTRVVADFDVLKSEQPLKRIVESLRGSWEVIQSDWRAAHASIEQKAPPLTRNQVESGILEIIRASQHPNLTEDDVDKIRKTLRATSSWDLAKQAGVDIVPTGEPRRRLNKLLDSLRDIGLFVVQCGELERFAPSVDGHGPGFVADVLKRDIAHDPELAGAREFVAALFAGECRSVAARTDAKVLGPSAGTSKVSVESAAIRDLACVQVLQSENDTARFHLKKIKHHLSSLFRAKNNKK